MLRSPDYLALKQSKTFLIREDSLVLCDPCYNQNRLSSQLILESSVIIEISFAGYRNLLLKNHDFALLHISYLEKNWVIAKDVREVEIVMEDATERYKKFLDDYPGLQDRIQQYHIASHLGITPTQLSRVRKKNLKNQPM